MPSLLRALRPAVFLCTVLLFSGRCAYVHAQGDFLKFDHRGKRELLEVKIVKDLIIVPMMVNGQGPYNFVLDTGVGLFIITDSTVVNTLKSMRTIRITGFGEGGEISAWIATGISVGIGRHIKGKLTAAVLKEDAFDLSGYTGMKVHGLLGYEFFQNFIVKIDYRLKLVTAYRQDRSLTIRKGTHIPITIEDRKPYLEAGIRQGGEIIPVKLIIDSGAGHPISLEADRNSLFKLPETRIPANLGVGLSGPIFGSMGRIDELHIGKHTLHDVIAAFPDSAVMKRQSLSVLRDGNLGNNVLKRFTVVFDYSREALYLRPAIGYNAPFEHDMSGLELSAAGDNLERIFIARVEPGSAGDVCGFEANDEILSINFKAVKNMTMQELDELFQSKDDRSLIVEIFSSRNKYPERLVLTLKRRI